MAEYKGIARARSEISKDHSKNQDCYIVKPNFCIIADGVSGSKAGDVAAREVVDYLTPRLIAGVNKWNSGNVEKNLVSLLVDTNRYIRETSQKKKSTSGMMASAIVTLRFGDDLYFAPVGDCGAYVFTNEGKLEKMTEEQTHTSLLVKGGIVSKRALYTHPTRDMLTTSLGMEKDPRVRVTTKPLAAVRYVLAASDGILKHVPEEDIEQILREDGGLDRIFDRLFAIWARPERVARWLAELDDEKSYKRHLEEVSRNDDATAILIESRIKGS